MNYDDKLEYVLSKIRTVLLAKHHDYGESNLKKHGLLGIVVRLSDKQARLDNLVVGNSPNAVKSETVMDTFIDIAGYAIQALVIFGDWEYESK